MAQYWVYLNNEVAGPFEIEQLIRVRGFSRQTLVRVDDPSNKSTNWISPAEIPELAHIFKAADEQHASAPTPAAVKAAPKASPRPAPKASVPLPQVRPPARRSWAWLWASLAILLIGGGAFYWSQWVRRGARSQDQAAAQTLVENAQLPAPSLYGTLRQYMQEKSIRPRWEFERVQDGLYHVTLSWQGRDSSPVYAFEANTQAQTVRGLNTAASTLMSEGFPPPAVKVKSAPPLKKDPDSLFPQTLDSRRQAIESGDSQTVWSAFSRRKKTEMAKAGMSQDGFIRLQNLTYHVDSAVKQAVMKTKKNDDGGMLVLLKQTQPEHPDIYIKQLWIYEDDEWKLDDEEKHSAETPTSPAAAAPSDQPVPAKLPGMSN